MELLKQLLSADKILTILLKLLPDNALCLLEEKCFKEMESRGFIIWSEESLTDCNDQAV